MTTTSPAQLQAAATPPATRSPAETLAELAVGGSASRMSAGARHASVLAMLDCLGVLLAAGGEPPAEIPSRVLAAIEAPGTASVIGAHGVRLSPPSAALANGARAHSLDFDDVHHPWVGHPTTVLLPALLAVAEHLNLTGQQVVTAYAAGLSVGHALGGALNMQHYQRGWHATATFGSLAAAAACANLLELTSAQTQHALGIAASEASGLRQNFGSMVKPLHAGLAARNGVLAALLAQAGLTADTHALDGPLGFAHLFGGGVASPEADDDDDRRLADGLGQPPSIDDAVAGLSIKQYPSCAATQPALDAVLQLVRQHAVQAERVDRIVCEVGPLVPAILVHARPTSGLQGKFSLQYCMAVSVLDGEVGLAQFTDARAADPNLRRLVERVEMRVDPAIDPHGEFGARITLLLVDGRHLSAYAPRAKGTPQSPLEPDDIIRKFRLCAALALRPDAVDGVLERLLALDSPVPVRQVVAAIDAGLDRP